MISRVLSSAICLVLPGLLIAQQTAATSTIVQLLKGTDIHLKLDQDLSSATVREGQQVRFVVTEDVVADGAIAIPAGTAVYRKVAFAQPAGPNKFCGDENNGWFSLGDPVLLSSSGKRMKLTLLPPGSFLKEPMSPHEKLLAAVAVPLQIPAIAILIAAPIVLIPIGIAEGVHDRWHHPKGNLQVPDPYAAAQALQVTEAPLPTTIELPTEPEPATEQPLPLAPQSMQIALPAQLTTVELPLLSPGSRSPQGAAPAAPCPTNSHEMEWKATEAKVETYYLVHDYTVRPSLPAANPEPATAKETH
jgi:hypothetical protein